MIRWCRGTRRSFTWCARTAQPRHRRHPAPTPHTSSPVTSSSPPHDRQPDRPGMPRVHFGQWRQRPHNPHTRSRRSHHAPPGAGVKATPAARVDLRSSLDPDPLPAYARTEPKTPTNRSQAAQDSDLTRPRLFRDDPHLDSPVLQARRCARILIHCDVSRSVPIPSVSPISGQGRHKLPDMFADRVLRVPVEGVVRLVPDPS